MKLKKALIFSFFLFIAASVHSQSEQAYPRGAILDEELYNSLLRKAPAAARSYEGLPSASSLKQFAPLPGDQGTYNTCVGWASAYAARTISESVALNRMNQTETTQNAFSPVYVYRSIRPNDPRGQQGASIQWALELMSDTGAVKMLDIERSIHFPGVDLSRYEDSKSYPIAGYVTLFSRDDRYKPGLVTGIVKKSIAEGKPVIIGMNTPDSFYEAKDVWEPKEDPGRYYGGHALCVVGYDDNKSGGVFEVINSWGRKWGNGGFIWIPYNVFIDFVMEGYEIAENLAVYSDKVKFDGYVQVELLEKNEPKTVPLTLDANGYYRTAELGEGTALRFTVGSAESAYVYSFMVSRLAQDNAYYSPILMFPHAGVSPLLNYSDSVVVLPGEDKAFTLDAEAGVKFLITLYAKQALDIQTVLRRFNSAKGSLNERLLMAVGDNLFTALSHNEREASFTVEPADPRAVAALVVAIECR